MRRIESEGNLPFEVSPIPAANVSTIPLRSPLRYPGGKTWLIPHIREWLKSIDPVPQLLVEPFCGGGIVSLTAVMENLVEQCVMVELDRNVAAFWHAATRHTDELCRKIENFEPCREAIEGLVELTDNNITTHAFRTLVYNRTRRGGILAPGASFTRKGESGKGIASRWYPQTLIKRLQNIATFCDRIAFFEGDGMSYLSSLSNQHSVLFIDPPYTARGKQAGKRLYAHHDIDHARLFELVAESDVEFLMTYDSSPDIVSLIRTYEFAAVRVEMTTTHHTRMPELVITRRPNFFQI